MISRPPAGLANDLIRELAGWLETPDMEGIAAVIGAWPASTWSAFERVVSMHGLAPSLAGALVRSDGPGSIPIPPATAAWLIEQDRRNTERIRRMHDQLEAILAGAATAGVEVMPLKGALLTTLPGADPIRRPMADLDLLVHPTDRAAMRALLEGLGYRHEPDDGPRATHDVFIDPGGGRLVSPEGEHPDNPRRVEVHVEVKRHLWGWVDDDDLTAALWAGAQHGEVLGRPATLPRTGSLIAHLAIHATSDLLVGRGRLVQWLDLGWIARRAGDRRDLDGIPASPDGLAGPGGLAGMPHPRLVYPSLRLAQRALPVAMAALDIGGLERHGIVPPRLARWAAAVPLDSRCGLTTGRPPAEPATFGARWERWRPEPWRLAVAYGDLPIPVALARHVGTVGRLAWARTRGRRLRGRLRPTARFSGPR